MKFSKLSSMITRNWSNINGQKLAYLILGKPGGGKSALALEIVAKMGGTPENTVVFVPSLRDPVDVLGTPRNNGTVTEWVPPAEFYKLRAGVGKCFLVIEEMSDASVAMMNAMCRIVHDRHAGDLGLSQQLFIIGTGNRTEDKSGANRLTTKLGNRLNVQEYDENLEDWVEWALNNNIDPVLVQFLRFKPNMLSDFDPNRPYGTNPTPRTWEFVNYCDTTAPTDEYFQDIKGLVGEGAAAEYAAFRKIYASLISFDEVVMNPKTVTIPKDLSAQYAIVGSVSHNTTVANIERVAQFVERLPSDFGVMFWQDTVKRTPGIKTSKPFIQWATSAGNVLMN
jgi:MoxR-like ATPase